MSGGGHGGEDSAVVLLTPTRPDAVSVGALFIKDLTATAPDIAFTLQWEPAFLMGARAPGILSRLVQAAAARLSWYGAARLRLFRMFVLARRVEAVAAVIRATGASRLWVTASSPEVIFIAEQLARRGIDLRVTVWDTPEYSAANLHLDDALVAQILASFAAVLRAATRVSVIGQAMRQLYAQKYGVDSVIIRHGISLPALPMAAPPPSGDLRIAFAGSLYSKVEWNSLIAALESIGWRLDGRPISLHFIGRFPLSGAIRTDQLILHGEKTFAETMAILSGMHIGYLPYWFDTAHELVARTSFPGKMSAYAAAGLAVFHHAPAYTEATTFLQQYRFGLACASLEPAEIVDALRKLVELAPTDPCREARTAALRDELSQEAMAARFANLLEGAA